MSNRNPRARNSGRKAMAPGLREVLARELHHSKAPKDTMANLDLPSDLPKCPPELKGRQYGEAKWNEVVFLLHTYKIMTAFDRAVVLQYCLAYDDWICSRDDFEASKKLSSTSKNGFTITTETGVVKSNPIVAVMDRAGQRHLSLLCELGMTPASRSRVQMQNPDDNEVDEFDS